MDKIIQYDALTAEGEHRVQLAAFTNRIGRSRIEKFASASPATDYLNTISPEAGATYALVLAVSDFEAYDSNRNGDGFPNRPYGVGRKPTCGHPECIRSASNDGWIKEAETLKHHYQTFESHGKVYLHHRSSDPAKNVGSIIKAFRNERMRRIELLVKAENRKAPDIAERIRDDLDVAVSMGCRVGYDVCTICGHRAKTRAHYCEHCALELRHILENGEIVAVLNPSPLFFDLSFVWRPGDPQGYVMKKVAQDELVFSSAHLGELWLEEKHAQEELMPALELCKAANASTELGSLLRDDAGATPLFSDAALERFAPLSWADKLATCYAAGLILSDAQLFQLNGSTIGVKTAEALAMVPTVMEVLVHYPSVYNAYAAAIGAGRANEKLAADLQKDASNWEVGRSIMFQPRTNSPWSVGPAAAYRTNEPGRTELLTMQDPYSGRNYQTTRGAAMDAGKEDTSHALAGSALLSAIYGVGLHHAFKGKLSPWIVGPAALGLGWKTYKGLRNSLGGYRNPQYVTDQGPWVSGGTEFKHAQVQAITEKFAADAKYLPKTKWATLSSDDQLATLTSRLQAGPTDDVSNAACALEDAISDWLLHS